MNEICEFFFHKITDKKIYKKKNIFGFFFKKKKKIL